MRLRSEWDELAVACALPLMAPATVMSWWRHLAPPSAEPRSVAVRDGKQLIGLAPFYVTPEARQRVDYRLPGIELAARLSPLATPGREWEVAGVVAQALATARPRPDLIALEGHPSRLNGPRHCVTAGQVPFAPSCANTSPKAHRPYLWDSPASRTG